MAEKFPNRLGETMKQKNIGPTALAREIGATKQDISRWARGERKLPIPEAVKIARALNVSVSHIMMIDDLIPRKTWVPLLSWQVANSIQPDKSIPYTQTIGSIRSVILPKGSWFALEIEDDAMDRIAPVGSRIFVNTVDNALVEDKYYIFRGDEGRALFRRYRSDPSRIHPYSTNPNHETKYINEENFVIGRVNRIITDV